MKEIIDAFLKESREWRQAVSAWAGLIPAPLKDATWNDGTFGQHSYHAIYNSGDIARASEDTFFGELKWESGNRLVITDEQLLWFCYSWNKGSGYNSVEIKFSGNLSDLQGAEVTEVIRDGRASTFFLVRFSGGHVFELPSEKLAGARGLATMLNGVVYARLAAAARSGDTAAVARCVNQIPNHGQLAASKWPAWVQDRQGNRVRARELLDKAIVAQDAVLAQPDDQAVFPLYQSRLLDDMVELAVAWSREAQDYWTAFNYTGSGLVALNPANCDQLTKRHDQSYRDLVGNLATLEPERRHIVLISREVPVVQDQRLLTLSDQNVGPLTFSNGTPIEGEYYVMDPVDPMLYHPLEDFNTLQFKHQFHAALTIIDRLVPKRVSLTNSEVRSESVRNESNQQSSQSQSRKNAASAKVSTPGLGVEGQADWGGAEAESRERARSDSQSLATRVLAEFKGGDYVISEYPVAPAEDDFYYRTDLELQRLVKDRLSGGALKKTVRVELSKTISITTKTLDRLEESLRKNLAVSAKVSHKASKVSVGGKFKTDFQSESKNLQTAKKEIDKKLDFSSVLDIEFFSMEEISQVLKKAPQSVPLERQLLDQLRRLQSDNPDWPWMKREVIQFGKDHGIPVRDIQAAFRKFRAQRSEWVPRHRFISDVIRHLDARLSESMFAKAIERTRTDLDLPHDHVADLVAEARERAKARSWWNKLLNVAG